MSISANSETTIICQEEENPMILNFLISIMNNAQVSHPLML